MIQKIVLLLLLLTGFSALSHAQERSFGTLPLVQKPGIAPTYATKSKDSPEYQAALKVYERLVQARGDFRYPVPDFVLSTDTAQVAYMRYDILEIGIEQAAYDVCANYFPDTAMVEAAIAFLLGHELTHYYEKHAWRRGFVADHGDLNIGIKLVGITDTLANETEADYLGGFLAYSAGFGLFDRGDELIGNLYKAYGLDRLTPDELAKMEKKYPSLSDRKTLVKRSAEKMNRLVDVFDMANLLTAIGEYAEAYEYYRHILMEYQSRETYNNLGAAAVLHALQYFNPNELKFRYPIELDLESSASKGEDTDTLRNKLLHQAILHFDAAISLDANYAPAYLNKAVAFALLGDNVRARFYAQTEAREAALKGHYPKTAVDTDVLLAILDWHDKPNEAEKAFERAAIQGSDVADYNLKRARGEDIEPEQVLPAGLPEKIDGQTMDKVKSGIRSSGAINKEFGINAQIVLYQNTRQGANSRLFASYNKSKPRDKNLLLIHLTNPGYPGKTEWDIEVGHNRKAIVAEYGEPSRTVETPRGQIMVYQTMLFILGVDGKLERWANYSNGRF